MYRAYCGPGHPARIHSPITIRHRTNCTHRVKAGLCRLHAVSLETIPFPETSKTFVKQIFSLQNIKLLCRTSEIIKHL